MNPLKFIPSSDLCLEIGQSSLKVLEKESGLELPLERQENGRLTSSCKEKLVQSLRGLLKKRSRVGRPRAFCAIGARGVSLRRLTLPSAPKENFEPLLLLQIEKEFPLPPNELAWGFGRFGQNHPRREAGAVGEELVVVAVKKEMIEEYSEVLSGCGLSPVFTLGALAASALCPRRPGSSALLDIGRSHSELICFDDGVPSSIRSFPWGGVDITRALEQGLALSHEEAERVKIHLDGEAAANSERGQQIQTAIRGALNSLAASIQAHWTGEKLYLIGKSAQLKEVAPWLAAALRNSVQCERIELPPGLGRSAALLGVRESCEENGRFPLLVLQVRTAKDVAERIEKPTQWKWVALAAALALGSFSLRYAEAWIKQPGLARKLSDIKAARARLPEIDRELSFLQYLQTNQPPYLNVISALAEAAARGTRFESLSINRRGDLALKGTMQNAQQATDFRSKLIESGLFPTVVVDEQTPSPDRQKVSVRITARWLPALAAKLEAAVKTNAPAPAALKTNAPPGKDKRT